VRRRQFIALLGHAAVAGVIAAASQRAARLPVIALSFPKLMALALVAWFYGSVLAFAQQPETRTPVIGFLSPASMQTVRVDLLRAALAKHGLVDGKNFRLDIRVADGNLDRLPELAAALVRDGVTVIFATGDAAGRAAQAATNTLPIVNIGDDLVGSGLISTLAKPGGNLTGVSILATELDAKRIEVLKELLPTAKRFGLLYDPAAGFPGRVQGIIDTAGRLGLDLRKIDVLGPNDLEPAFQKFKANSVEGVNIASSSMLFNLRPRLGELSLTTKIPAICQFREMVEVGCLASYGFVLSDLYAMSSDQIVKLLQGAKPADLAVAQPSRFELIINLKTAKALGLTIPPSLLARADEVIE
jgi:putative ABC transport system substrate-binding protein